MAGEAPRGDHDIITFLPEPGGPDAIHLPPDVVPDWLEKWIMALSISRVNGSPVEIVSLKIPQGRHVLIEDVHLVEATGLDGG